jgi:hypothetical protein
VVPWLGEINLMMADISSVEADNLYLITHAAAQTPGGVLTCKTRVFESVLGLQPNKTMHRQLQNM